MKSLQRKMVSDVSVIFIDKYAIFNNELSFAKGKNITDALVFNFI
jgi:hypothetical protein